MSTSTTTRGLTVAQLKALCKDLGLKNYSKLGKAALLEKIQAVRAPEPTPRAQERLVADVGAAVSEAGTASASAGAGVGGEGSTSTGRAGAGSTLTLSSNTAHLTSSEAPPQGVGPATREHDTTPARPSRKMVHSALGLGGATTSTSGGTSADVPAGAPTTLAPNHHDGVSSTSTLLSSSPLGTPEEDTRRSLARPPPDPGLVPGGRPSSALSSSPPASSSTLASSPGPNTRAYASSSAFTTFSAIAPSSPSAYASSSTLASSPPARKRTASSAGLDRDAIVKVARTHATAARDRFKVPPVPDRPAAGLATSTLGFLGPVQVPAPVSASVGSSSRQSLATTSFQVPRPRTLPPASAPSPTPAPTPTLADKTALTSNSISSLVVNPSQPGRRFQPLRPTVTVVTSTNALAPPPVSVPLKPNDATLNGQLDFTILPSIGVPAPRLITLPMSLRQRGRARNWAIILIRLTNKERSNCILVCKAMRYGVYLSAAQILRTDFPGARLTSIIRGVALDVKDMWPYLRQRRAERASRRAAYDMSFLPSFYARFGILQPIASALWTSPDHEDQITVAIRFLITKAWFAISLGGSDVRIREWLQGTVIDAQEVTPRNVWTITQQQQLGSEAETLYVVYETCEVVGKSNSPSPAPGHDIPLRNDWATHIANGTLTKKPLLEYVVWHNGEDYNRGISTAWLRRVAEQGDLGRVKRQIAERYVLACVAANSVSGTYKTARQMADEFAGVSDVQVPTPNMPNKASHSLNEVNLYLPEHHYVESVCFITRLGKALQLHPALAAVQTPAREYIVLRDTGMHVGCEEDGVAEAWMDVLGCDTHGVAVA